MSAASMRPTAVLWAGALPTHWKERRARFMFDRLRLPPGEDDGVVTAFRDGQVTLRENRRSEGFTFATKEIGYQGVRAGNLVVHSMDGFAGAIGVSESSGKCSPVYVVCDPKPGVDARFHAYVLRHMALSGYITSLAKGIRERSTSFGWGELKEEWLPLPALPAQKAIADFLDRKTAAIDALIDKKQKLLELLGKKRGALINQAVTKGLDRKAPMKNSGIPWIGEIPEHWGMTRAKFMSAVITDCLHSTPEYRDEGFPALRTSDVLPGQLDLDNARKVDEDTLRERNQRLWPREGDVVYTREGGRFGIAAPVPRGAKLCLAQRVMLLRPAANTSPGFLMWALNSKAVFEQALVDTIGAASPRVNMETVANYVVPFPPRQEQEAIAQYLLTSLGDLDVRTQLVRDSQARLAEYRQALITAAVTGQLNIHDEAA